MGCRIREMKRYSSSRQVKKITFLNQLDVLQLVLRCLQICLIFFDWCQASRISLQALVVVVINGICIILIRLSLVSEENNGIYFIATNTGNRIVRIRTIGIKFGEEQG